MSNNTNWAVIISMMAFSSVSCGGPQNTSHEDAQMSNIVTQEEGA